MNNVENFFKKTDSVKLSIQEKDEIKKVLLERMSKKPTAVGDAYRWFVFFSRNSIAASCMFVIFFIGGTSAAAESSLPGDFLYPLKIGVNEQVRSWFAISTEAEAAWEVRMAERRFEELEQLQENSGLADSVLRNETETRFEEQRKKARALLTEDSGNEFSSNTNSSLSLESQSTSLPATFQEKRVVSEDQTTREISVLEKEEIELLKQEINSLTRQIRRASSDSQNLVRARLSLLGAKDMLLKIGAMDLENTDVRELIDDANLYIQITKDQIEKVYNEDESLIEDNEGAAVKALKKNKTSPKN